MSAIPNKFRFSGIAAALFFAGALAAWLFPDSANAGVPIGFAPAQAPPDLIVRPGETRPFRYDSDPRFQSPRLCRLLGGSVSADANVCSGMDANDTFCVVGGLSSLSCSGFYRHVILCNAVFNRPTVSPFLCGETCDEASQKALGAECRIRIDPDAALPPETRSADYAVTLGFAGPAHIITVLQSAAPDGTTLTFEPDPDHPPRGGFTLNSNPDNDNIWTLEPIRPLAREVTLNITVTGNIACGGEKCHPEGVAVVARIVAECPAAPLEPGGQPPDLLTELQTLEGAGGVCALIRMGAMVNTMDATTGDTPLHRVSGGEGLGDDADEAEFFAVVELLIKNGATINAQNARGDSPLHLAASVNFASVAELLLRNGASVNVTNASGNAPLHLAAGAGAREIALLLLEHGASVNIQNENLDTPLHFAVRSNDLELARLLLQNDAAVTLQNADFRTPIDSAVSEEIFWLLAQLSPFAPVWDKMCRAFAGGTELRFPDAGGEDGICLLGPDIECRVPFTDFVAGSGTCEDIFKKTRECNLANLPGQSATECGAACPLATRPLGVLCVNPNPVADGGDCAPGQVVGSVCATPIAPKDVAELQEQCVADYGGTVLEKEDAVTGGPADHGDTCELTPVDPMDPTVFCYTDGPFADCERFYAEVDACNNLNRRFADSGMPFPDSCGQEECASGTAKGVICEQ